MKKSGCIFLQMAPPIVISEVNGNTVISWDGGSQIVPNTVSVFGGGNKFLEMK